jgi:hypothetical protein
VFLALDFLYWFYEIGTSRLAVRDQPLPSKPVIPRQNYYSISGIDFQAVLNGTARAFLQLHLLPLRGWGNL